MELTAKLREGFCKDSDIPIKIFEEPYFSDRVKLYDEYYGCLDALEVFKEEVLDNPKYFDAHDYFKEYNDVRVRVVEAIKGSRGYQDFNSDDMNLYAVDEKYRGLSKKDIYNLDNVGKTFISVDIVKANFYGLYHYDSNIFEGATCWEDFISRFTGNRHIINSKYVRQVIFGNCNPKRQITYERKVMSTCLDVLLSNIGTDSVCPVCLHNDELVFDVSSLHSDRVQWAEEEFKKILSRLIVPVSVESFTLHEIPEYRGYFKEFPDRYNRPIEFKCVDSNLLPFAIRYIRGEDVTENDKVFVFNGRLAKYL